MIGNWILRFDKWVEHKIDLGGPRIRKHYNHRKKKPL